MNEPLAKLPDVWAPTGTDDLPPALVDAFEARDWPSVRRELGTIMDAAITDGAYGRELLQLVLRLPANTDPVFDRYRAAAMIDHGDWDGVRTELPNQTIEAAEVRGLRDILTATIDRDELPPYEKAHHRFLFEIYEFQATRNVGGIRRWAQRMPNVLPESLWEREDVAIGRHLRYRQLHDATWRAVGESQAGRLEIAHALGSEAQRLGDAGEPFRAVAHDIAELASVAMGDRRDVGVDLPARVARPTGPSPIGTMEMLMCVMPLYPLLTDGTTEWAANLAGYIAARLGSPRWQLQSDSWRVAAQLRAGSSGKETELAGLVARSRKAAAGLKALPLYLDGYAHRRYDSFEEASLLARRAGNVWLQISAHAWMAALDPRPRTARRLRQLIDATGWRRLVLVPSEIAADAALGMTLQGERSEAILELSLIADRPNVTTDVVSKFIGDPQTAEDTRLAAVNTLARVGTMHAREILSRFAQRRDGIGQAAAKAIQGPAYGLSEREIEVLSLAADGLTNKQIGEKLFLSHHTIARHLANARAKLGASNRAEAAVRLHRAGVD